LLGVERDEGVAGWAGWPLIGVVVSANRGKADDVVPGGCCVV
jgi:hypothetical protein